MTRTLSEALAAGVVVLDGGLATELERRGNDLSSAMWSARLLADRPQEITAAHRSFFEAGAQVATTASYQASFEGFARIGIDAPAAGALMQLSVELARRARDECGLEGWIAASVGPYGAMLADGSEYRGDYGISVADLRAFHRRRLGVLADAGADVLAVETIPCATEVEAIVAELDDLGVAAWISLTCRGRTTRAGEPVEAVFAVAASSKHVIAVGVNCTDPADVTELVRLAAESGKPVVAYPNSGERWDAERRCWTGKPAFSCADVSAWTSAGARLVGGCCRVGPDEIAAISATVRNRPQRSAAVTPV